MARLFVAIAAATAASLACAVPAGAATPVVVGQGDKPDVAVDAAGTAHIAFLNTTADPEEARYCRLPRGAAGCNASSLFTGSPDAVFGRAHVFVPTAGQVVVAYTRCCGVGEGNRAAVSGDGGTVFGAATVFGDLDNGSMDEAAYGPGSNITALSEVVTVGSHVQAGPVGGPSQDAAVDLGGISAGGAVAIDATGRPLAVYQVQTDPWSLRWRAYTGPVPATATQVNTPGNWGPEGTIANDRISAADGPALASGPSGVFLFWQKRLPDEGFVSKFTGSGWGPPVKISDGRAFNDHDLFQDAAGRLHAVWNAYSDEELRYRWSDDGVTWSAPVDIARGESYRYLRVSAAADHQGYAVWDRNGSDVAAVPLEALPPETPTDPGGPDTTDPIASGFDVGDPTLLPGQGTSFSFSSSEAGTAILTVRKLVPGLKVRKGGKRRCVPRTRRLVRRLANSTDSRAELRRLLRKRRCKARKRIGSIRKAVAAGENTIVWNGRIAGRKLRPGRYIAELQIRDATGNLSRIERVRFRVLKPRRRG